MTTLALLHLNGTNGSTVFTDAVGTLTWSRSGATAVLDTSQLKFGSASLVMSTGSVNSTSFTAQTTWTADWWVRFATLNHGVMALVGGNVNGFATSVRNQGNGSGQLYNVSYTGSAADANVTGTKTAWATGQWYHMAMTYDTVAGKYYFYVDGVKDGEIASATGMSGAGAVFNIGNNGTGSALDGWIDEFRYTDACEFPSGTTFSVPTSEYTVGSGITPSAGSLVFTGVAPGVSYDGARSIAPLVGSLVLTGQQVKITDRVAPGTGALVLTGILTSVPASIQPSAGSLSLTTSVPLLGATGRPSMRKYAGTGTAHGGAISAAILRRYTGIGTAADSNAGYGAPSLRKYASTGATPNASAPRLRKYSGVGTASGAVTGAATLRSYRALQITGSPRIRKYQVAGYATSVVLSTFRTHVMNTTNNAVTEYTGHRFNSFAQIGGVYYGAGPDGFIKLDGNDDAGTNINWKARTGQVDDKQIGLKRLPEVVMGLRASGPIRVRVYPDDNRFYDYMLPNVKTDTIRQHRVKPGKGMTGRYFMVELQGVANAAIELDSLQINMTPTTRRIG